MATARVELKGALSHSRGAGRVFHKGLPQILSDANEINYYRTQSAFTVTDLEEPKKPAQQSEPSGATAGSRAPKKTKAQSEEPPL